jgi:hypothetical protein
VAEVVAEVGAKVIVSRLVAEVGAEVATMHVVKKESVLNQLVKQNSGTAFRLFYLITLAKDGVKLTLPFLASV